MSLFSMDLALKFIGFLSTAYLARVLGKSGFGSISIGISVLSYALVLADCGLTALGIRKIASDPKANDITGQILNGKLILAVVIFLLTTLITFALSGLSENTYIILNYLFFLFPAAFMLEFFFVGSQKMDTVAYVRILGTIIYFLLVVIFIRDRGDAVLTGIAWTFGGVTTALFFFLFYKKRGLSFHFNGIRYFIKILKESFPLGMASYISQFTVAFPVVYIAYIAGNSQAGIFSAAFKMIGLFLVFDRVFVTLFLPKITGVISNREISLEKIFGTVLKIVVCLTLIVSMFLYLFSDFIIIKVFGDDYTESILIFKMLLVYFAFTIIDSVFANTLIGMKKEKVYTLSLLIAVIIILILTFVLTPFWGEYGIIFSFILLDIISLIYMIIYLKKDIEIKIARSIILPVILSSAVLLFLIFIQISIYFQLIIVIALFIPALIAITGFRKNEMDFIKRVFI